MKQKTFNFTHILFMLIVVIMLLGVGALFGGCSQKANQISASNDKTVLADVPLGILLGCSRHQQGFTKEECGKMWYWVIRIDNE